MSYKSIFTAMTEYDAATLDFAIKCAQAQDTHLDVMCVGLDRMHANYYEVGSNAMIVQAALEEAQESVASLSRRAKERLTGESLRWDVLESIWAASGIGRSVAAKSRFADLAIVAKPYGNGKRTEDVMIMEGLLFHAECPTLIVPEGNGYSDRGSVVIGWNESPEALRAIRASLPILKRSEMVHIAVIDPSDQGPERSDPGGPLAVYLARHGIECDIQIIASAGQPISDRLTQHVTDKDASMIVMGGYGHSRFREALLGGATRDMLENAKVPILMAH